MTTDDPYMLDSRAAGEILGVAPKTVERLARDGKIPPGIKIGRCRRWRKSALLAWIAQGEQAALSPTDTH